MPDGVVHQQRALPGVRGAGADRAGESLDGNVHGGEPGDPDRTSAPRLHLHHAALYPQLGQHLFFVELCLQFAPLLPQKDQLLAGVFTQRDAHQLSISHDAVDHHSPFFLSELFCLSVSLLEVF